MQGFGKGSIGTKNQGSRDSRFGTNSRAGFVASLGIALAVITGCGREDEGGKSATARTQTASPKDEPVSVVAPASAGELAQSNQASDAAHLSLAPTLAADAIFCPKGFSYDTATRFCSNGVSASGPFTEKMKADCKRFGGGPTCDTTLWNNDFAGKLRGTAECPAGTTREAEGLCVEGINAFGPFSIARVEKCRQLGGEEICDLPRWAKEAARATLPPVPARPPSSTVPYFCQLLNENSPGSTCGNTSLSMALSAVLGRTITPDSLWSYNESHFGYNLANSRERFAQVARSLGASGSRAAVLSANQMKQELDRGNLLVMQGYFTQGSGHIVVIVGYDDRGFVVNDPNGRWYGGRTGSGYDHCGAGNPTGRNLTYTYADMASQSLLDPNFSVGVIAR